VQTFRYSRSLLHRHRFLGPRPLMPRIGRMSASPVESLQAMQGLGCEALDYLGVACQQVLSWALARSQGERSLACARLAAFWDSGFDLWESLTSRRSLYRDSSQSSRAVARFSMAVTVVQ